MTQISKIDKKKKSLSRNNIDQKNKVQKKVREKVVSDREKFKGRDKDKNKDNETKKP